MNRNDIKLILGFAIFQLYVFLSLGFLKVFFVGDGVDDSGILLYWGSSIANILSLLICAALHDKLAKAIDGKTTLIVAGLLCAFGTPLLSLAPASHAAFMIFLVLSSIFTGVGTALFYFQLASRFITSDEKRAVSNVFYAYCLSFLLSSIFGFVNGVFAVVFTSLLPCIIVILLLDEPSGGLSVSAEKSMTEESKKVLTPLLVKLCISVLVFSFCSGIMKSVFLRTPTMWNIRVAILIAGVTLAVMALVAILRSTGKSIDAVIIYRCVFFVAIVCITLLILDGEHADDARAIHRVSGELFRCLLFIFCLRLCQRTHFHPLAVFGSLLALSKIGSFAMGRLGASILETYGATTQGLLLIVMLAALYLFIFSEEDVRNLMETSHVVTSLKKANKERCEALAKKTGLTPREAEVLELYSQGKTLAVIAETMHLSESTVNMHRRKIYTKLGIHSKQELLELLEHEEQD